MYLSGRALFSPTECAAVVAEAEAAAAAAEGGWSTLRHYSVPTTDLPVHTLPHTLRWFNSAMRTSLAPMLAAQFPRTVAAAHRVRRQLLAFPSPSSPPQPTRTTPGSLQGE